MPVTYNIFVNLCYDKASDQSFWGVKIYMWIFILQGVHTSDPHIVQGSTLSKPTAVPLSWQAEDAG